MPTSVTAPGSYDQFLGRQTITLNQAIGSVTIEPTSGDLLRAAVRDCELACVGPLTYLPPLRQVVLGAMGTDRFNQSVTEGQAIARSDSWSVQQAIEPAEMTPEGLPFSTSSELCAPPRRPRTGGRQPVTFDVLAERLLTAAHDSTAASGAELAQRPGEPHDRNHSPAPPGSSVAIGRRAHSVQPRWGGG